MATKKKETPEAKLLADAVGTIAWADERLANFRSALEEDPAHAFEWGRDAVTAAASRDVAFTVKRVLEQGRTAEGELDAKHIMAVALDQTLIGATGSRSTSAMANLVADEKTTAWARVFRTCLSLGVEL